MSFSWSINNISYDDTEEANLEFFSKEVYNYDEAKEKSEVTTTINSLVSDDLTEDGLLRDYRYSNLIWTGPGQKTPVILFSTQAVINHDMRLAKLAQCFNLSFKFITAESRLVRSILKTHGFREVAPNCHNFNIIWTGCQIKAGTLKNLTNYQKINHFPRSYELSRKDRLFKNVQRLQTIKGVKHFDFMPASFVLPTDFSEFCTAFLSDRGPYIVKPIDSSRGRGIFLCNHPDQISLDEPMVVSRYIGNPYLIDGFKFDVRLYVAVTSFDPLVVYVYEEGLVRFATVKYKPGCRNLKSRCMHLTNYSVNKKNLDFVHNDNADVEDFGNKWSLGALLRYLKSLGKDTTVLMMKIEDVIIKTLLSVEMSITAACRMFQPHRDSCFELYGFDIILDETLRPWLLEVNVSPSLACESPLDLKIKSHMMTHLFNLVGIVCRDPKVKSTSDTVKTRVNPLRLPGKVSRSEKSKSVEKRTRVSYKNEHRMNISRQMFTAKGALSRENCRMLRSVREEYQRRGGWLRIYPRRDSWHTYQGFYETSSSSDVTLLLHQKLFPSIWFTSPSVPPQLINMAGKIRIPVHRFSEELLDLRNYPQSDYSRRLCFIYETAKERVKMYERKLRLGRHRVNPYGTCSNTSLPVGLVPFQYSKGSLITKVYCSKNQLNANCSCQLFRKIHNQILPGS